ncbi:MAG: two-component regulator propeller domain-containing protein, partial [Flavipsychrobacter sp.]
MMKSWLILVFVLATLCANAQLQQPFVRNLWLNESNTATRVNAMVQDDAGYIWLGTDAGLYRFNGRNITVIPDSSRQSVTAVWAKKNEVWIGYSNGKLGKIINDTVRAVQLQNTTPASTIRAICKRGDMLLLCTEQGIYGVLNDMAVSLNSNKGLSDDFTYCLAFGNNKILAGTDKGINIISEQKGSIQINAIVADAQSGLTDNIVRVIKTGKMTGSFWIGTEQGGVLKMQMDAAQRRTFYKCSIWTWGQVNDILPISNNAVWVGTDDGYLLKVVVQRDSVVVTDQYKPAKSIKRILRDNTGNIWCATNQGIAMVTVEYATYIQLGKPYALDKLTTMMCDSNNTLWFAENDDLYSVSLNDSLANPQRRFEAPTAITTLFADNKYGLWAGTFGNGLYFLNGSKASHIDNIDGADGSNILDIAALQGHLWIASLNGVAEAEIINNATGKLELIRRHNKQGGLGSDYIYQLYPDNKGRLWMATDGGGVCMYDGNYHRWDSTTGINSKVVYSITEDASGNIWAGTLEKGLFWFNGNRWQNVKRHGGLQDINISSVASNATGQVIVVNQKGVDEWYENTKQFRHFNRRFYLNVDSMSKVLNCYAKDREGNVYVPFEEGLIVFKNQYAHFDIKPNVQITGISTFLTPVPLSDHHFDFDENNIRINFDGISYANPELLHYRYQLQGYSEAWINTDDESVTFPKLPPGKYTFHVKASLNDDFDQATEATYSFVIATPFWRERWFIITAFSGFILLGYSLLKLREKRLRAVADLQKERYVFEYEHLKSQVNPHFLFNSLNTLASLIEEDPAMAANYTTQLSDLYRHMIANKDKDLIPLAEEIAILSNYMYIQQSRF